MNSTLTNGLELLLHLAQSPRPHTIKELAERMGRPHSHVHRLLQTLVEAQYVEKTPDRRYAIGIGALRLGHALLADNPIRRRALPVMKALAERTQLSVTLAMPFGDGAMSVAYVSHDGRIRPFDETLGRVLSPHASASGKLFLAHLPDTQRDATLLRLDLPRHGPHTLTTVDDLRDELADIRDRGYSLNDRENGPTVSLAVPIHGSDHTVVAALGLSGRDDQLTPADRPALIDALTQTTESLSTHELEPATP